MKISAYLAAIGLAGTAVLFAQLRATADPPGLAASGTAGGIAGGCTPGTGPDVIVGALTSDSGNTLSKWGTVGDITGYSFGTTSCNVGDQNLQWDSDTNNHPVIGMNLYRLRDDRFEQVGLSWLKHGFAALTQNLCCTCQNPGTSQLLGVGCSDPYGAGLNGSQGGFAGCGGACGGLGPRFEVNATTGAYSFPYFAAGMTGNAIYKRLQVHNDDLDPALNPGAQYFAEGHYVTPDDAAAANHHNNASYREVMVGAFSGGGWNLDFTGGTTQQQSAIFAWTASNPSVGLSKIEDDGDPLDAHDGRFFLGHLATDNGNGTWHYEYALYNMNSHRSAGSFTVDLPAGVSVSNVGFHDVDYHSGDGVGGVTQDGTDWVVSVGATSITWQTDSFADNANANALRWGSLYNFRFDANAEPATVNATIGLFRPGSPSDVTTTVKGPGTVVAACPWDCGDGNGSVDTVDFLALLGEWGQVGTPCDISGGGVDTVDFLDLLANWGPCP